MTEKQPSQIGIYIKNTRHSLGISQGKLSDMIGVDVSLICRIEIGSRSPSRKTVIKLATVLASDQRELLRMAGLPLRPRKVIRPNRRKLIVDDRVGTYIRNMRQAIGMTQSALAQAAGIGTTSITHIEQLGRLPSKKTFGRILQALGTNEQEMMALTGSRDGSRGVRKDVDTILYGPIDPLAAMALRCQPVEIQTLVVDLLLSMKLIAQTLKRQLDG